MEKIKVLIVSGKLTIEHTYRETNERIRTLLESTGRFDVKITEAFGGVRKCPGTDPKVLVTVFDDVKFYDVPWWPPAHHPVHIPDGSRTVTRTSFRASTRTFLWHGKIPTEKAASSAAVSATESIPSAGSTMSVFSSAAANGQQQAA